jgi:deoxyadenosine/deoxycytidine kinase
MEKNLKIAFSGSSGSGKTTLVTFVKEKFGLTHISGSAGDVKKEEDKAILDNDYAYPGGGHVGVIRYSALNPEYGLLNQEMLQMRRQELIENNDNFVTDRSPADNLTYFINQVAYHPMVTDEKVEEFMQKCLEAWEHLSHVIYVKAVQPAEVERNGSRVANRYYQKAIDCQFEFWINNYFLKKASDGPKVLIIDFWDLNKRKELVTDFIKGGLLL